MDRDQLGQKETADRLIAALRQEEFILFAQPIVPVVANADEPAYQEILVRFLEEEEKLLPPGSFIPILEGFRLMPYLDRWVVNRTVRWLRAMRRSKPEATLPRNSINLSVDTLHDPHFAPFVSKQVEAAGISGECISFEIMCADAMRLTDRVREFSELFKSAGCSLTVAGFDGDNGSMEMVKLIAPGFVKFRSGLIGRMDRDAMAAARVDGLNRKCHSLGIRTIAEHVERPETLEILRQTGIDFAQGFLVGVPHALD
jgi:EAL domain-containing protein (putative c-di-GMP-specific phosphodiesterase class I)